MHEAVLPIPQSDPVGLLRIAPDGGLLEADDAALRLLGSASLPAPRKLQLESFVAEVDRPALSTLHANASRGMAGALACSLIAHNSPTRRVVLHASPLRDHSGAVTAWMAVICADAPPASTTAELRASEERLRFAAKASNVGLWDWDLDTNVVVFSPEWKGQIGYTEAEIANDYLEWERRLHPDDCEPTFAALRAYFSGTRLDYAVEFRMRHKDGSYRWIFARGEILRDKDGRAVRMLGCHVDITDRKRSEAERQEHLWFFQSLDRVNLEIGRAGDLAAMLGAVLDTMLDIFKADRAWLVYPCDPDAPAWHVPMERTRPEFPGAMAGGREYPMDPETAAVARNLRRSDQPVVFGPGTGRDVPSEIASRHHVQSLIAMELRPKTGAPWMLGMHQCSHARTWNSHERQLLAVIGQRLGDGVTSMLISRDLQESEQRLAAAERVAHVGYWDADLVNSRVIMSDEARRILGAPDDGTPSDVVQWRAWWYAAMHPDDRARVAEAASRSLAEADAYEVDYRLLSPGGKPRFVHMQAVVTRNDAGQPVRVFGTQQDVTSLRRTEEALRQSEEHLTALIRSVDGIVWEADAETFQFTFVSSRAERLLGYSTQRWITEPTFWADHLHPDDRESAVSFCAQCTAEHRDHEFEYRMLAADGRVLWLRDIVTVDLEPGREVKLRGIMVDITAQKQAEHRIRQLNRTYAVLSDINQLIVRERDPQAIFHGACDIAIQRGGFLLAWIAVEENVGRPGRLIAAAGDAMPPAARIEAISNGMCAADRLVPPGHIVHNDLATVLDWWATELCERGTRSIAQFPLAIATDCTARFVLCAAEAGFFDAEELRLLDELAADIAFALIGCERERERERALAQLRDSEERFRELAETIQEVFWVTEPDKSRLLYISPAYELVWGRTCESLRSSPSTWIDAIHPDDRDRVRHAAHSQQISGTYDEEYRVVRPDGEVRWIRDLAYPVRNANGEATRIVGVARDITERKLAQEELLRRDEHFRLLIENASDLITVINHAGIVRFQSPSAEHVLGIPPDELVGRNALAYVHADDVASVAAALHDVAGNPDEPVKIEFRLRRRDGGWCALQAVGRSIPGQAEDGFIVLNSRDITESRQLEEQFRQSQKLEAIGQLAGGVAHDFNNMLAAILLQTELASLPDTTPDEIADGLQQVRATAERAANLTRQLLLFSRRQTMQPRELDLNEVVTSLAAMLQRIIGEDVRLQLHLAPCALGTYADAGMLDQVLLNLAVNARDAMPDGGRLLIETAAEEVSEATARLRADVAPGRYVCMSVSDTGVGIEPEVMPRIFEPFFTTKEPGKGTGLGLATVFGIVKQHRGWIDAHSTSGEGTVFHIHLPASAATPERLREAPARALPRGTETIFVVEDDTTVRALTRSILERHGYKVIEAPNGPEALAAWPQHRAEVALLLTDLVMPGGLTGQALARRLAADRPDLKVIYTSGYSAEIAGREMHLRESENFIQKPAPPEQLLETIRSCLDRA